MFAVPGWTISADALKTQEDPAGKKLTNASPKDRKGTSQTTKKRKRGHGKANGVKVTEENLADLWTKHIEGKSRVAEDGTGSMGKKTKKRRKERMPNEVEVSVVKADAVDNTDGDRETSQAKVGKSRDMKDVESSPLAEPVKHDIKPGTDDEEQNVNPKEASKTKFEDRKRKALEKKEKKTHLQANGTIPPPRPTNNQDALLSSDSPKTPSLAEPRRSPKTTAPSDKSDAHTPKNTVDITTHHAKAKPYPLQVQLKPPPQAPASKLTPLQQSMQSKLVSARFRHLNQTLYTTASMQASQLFTETPSAFSSYHAGFRAQVVVWPQNPVSTFIEDVKARATVGSGRDSQKKLWRQERKGKGKGTTAVDGEAAAIDAGPTQDLDPLPRTRGTCTIADLGCGDASLAAALRPLSKSLHLCLHSFDLAKGDGPNSSLITVADISNLCLTDGSVDVAIFCLALMGTNWIDFVEEVGRVVRWGGECWVAEIKSRFGRPAVKRKGKQGKRKDEEEEVITEVEEEVAGKQREKTDVSAFVDVWRRRGFELRGEVDMGNKMFVKMRFVKKLTPTKGKGVPKNDAFANGKDEERGHGKFRGKKRFLDDTREDDVDESKVLKPCIYKTR